MHNHARTPDSGKNISLPHPKDDIAGQFQLNVPGLLWCGKFNPLGAGLGDTIFSGVKFAFPVIKSSKAKAFGAAKFRLGHGAVLLLINQGLPLFFAQSF